VSCLTALEARKLPDTIQEFCPLRRYDWIRFRSDKQLRRYDRIRFRSDKQAVAALTTLTVGRSHTVLHRSA
jgi:hypothetical protein